MQMVESTDIMMAVLTATLALIAGIQAYYIKLSYRAYKLMSRPIVFAWLRDEKENPGIRVENAGKGAAWNGKITILALPSKTETEYGFTRLYEQSRYEYPIEGQRRLLFKSSDKKLKIRIMYEDEEKNGEKYPWEGDFELPERWLSLQN